MKIPTSICKWFSVGEVLSLNTYYCEKLESEALHILKFISFCRTVLDPGYMATASTMISFLFL